MAGDVAVDLGLLAELAGSSSLASACVEVVLLRGSSGGSLREVAEGSTVWLSLAVT